MLPYYGKLCPITLLINLLITKITIYLLACLDWLNKHQTKYSRYTLAHILEIIRIQAMSE